MLPFICMFYSLKTIVQLPQPCKQTMFLCLNHINANLHGARMVCRMVSYFFLLDIKAQFGIATAVNQDQTPTLFHNLPHSIILLVLQCPYFHSLPFIECAPCNSPTIGNIVCSAIKTLHSRVLPPNHPLPNFTLSVFSSNHVLFRLLPLAYAVMLHMGQILQKVSDNMWWVDWTMTCRNEWFGFCCCVANQFVCPIAVCRRKHCIPTWSLWRVWILLEIFSILIGLLDCNVGSHIPMTKCSKAHWNKSW